MIGRVVKRYMPRGLYGRAALILLVPIIGLQLVIGVAFVQRHFDGVTRQMTQNLALQVQFLAQQVADAPNMTKALSVMMSLQRPLDMQITFDNAQAQDQRFWYDITGRSVIATLRADVPNVNWVDLLDERSVQVSVQTPKGAVVMTFDRRRVSASNPHQLLVLTVITGALMALVSIVFLRNQMRPIRRLALAAEAFGRGQRTEYTPHGAVEVRAAWASFLDMRGRIERQMEQRTMMLSGVSHDLRTPLTRLKLALSLSDDEDATAMMRDVEEMENLLNAFLDFARSDALEAPETIDLGMFVTAVIHDFTRSAQAVHLELPDGKWRVSVRPIALRRALSNLIGNALRYAKTARVCVVVTPAAVRFIVEDDGPGIPEGQREQALKPFSRLDQSRNQNKGSGLGLGLAIAADIARGHGGVLRLGKSEELQGLKAEIVLPGSTVIW
jgi:two-component system osmolarity sensor histidine kinase EnvZ